MDRGTFDRPFGHAISQHVPGIDPCERIEDAIRSSRKNNKWHKTQFSAEVLNVAVAAANALNEPLVLGSQPLL